MERAFLIFLAKLPPSPYNEWTLILYSKYVAVEIHFQILVVDVTQRRQSGPCCQNRLSPSAIAHLLIYGG